MSVWKKYGFTTAFTLVIAAASAGYAAQEFPAGDAVVKNGMEIVPHYLTGIMMEGAAPMGPNDIHLEVDVHAAQGETHGFAKGEWIPYLTVSYTLEKAGGAFKKSGALIPMTAGDGPHYANNLTMDGPGQYHLTYHFEPPSKAGFLRHIDKATGVPEWWKPFDADWTFTYPATPPAK